MTTSARIDYPLPLLVGGVVAAHAAALLLPSVNLEFAFSYAAKYFLTDERQLLDQYFSYQANTLGIPLLASALARAFSTADPLPVLRAMSLAGVLFMSVGIIRIAHHIEGRPNYRLLAACLFNPLIWVYAGRGTADFLPAALGLLAISLPLGRPRQLLTLLAAGGLLGLAGVLKYHELALALVLGALLPGGKEPRALRMQIVVVLGTAALITLLYLVKVHQAYGFWLTPSRYQTVHRLRLENVVSNLVAYTGFLAALSLPFSLNSPGLRAFLRRHWKILVLPALALFGLGAALVQNNGEMDLGPLNKWVPDTLQAGVFLLLATACLVPLHNFDAEPEAVFRRKRLLGLAVLSILLALSFSRPAQRYLIPLLPLFLLALPKSAFQPRWLVLTTLALFAAANAFVGYSQWCTGTAAEKMLAAIAAAGLSASTDPGDIERHVGNPFRVSEESGAAYTVVAGTAPNALITTASPYPFARRSYSLVPAR